MLELRNITAGYGETQVLFDISLSIGSGEVVTLLGRNGMGKTTTIYTLMGAVRRRSGDIRFRGVTLNDMPAYKVARQGIALVPEGRQIFPTLSVLENLVATSANRTKAASPWTVERIYALFPQLHERRTSAANLLSGGEQQMLAIGRALMTNPHLLIFDEATEGLAPLARQEIWNCLRQLKGMGQAILLIDKNLGPLCELADRHVIVHKGRSVWEGTSDDLFSPGSKATQYLEL